MPTRTQLTTKAQKRQRGAALVLFTVMLIFVLIPFVGLAIDGAVMMLLYTKLSAATDAAALAAARSLSLGEDAGSQAAAAANVAQQYVTANFPAGTFGSAAPAVSTAVTEPQPAKRAVTVQTTASAPSYFLRIIGVKTLSVSGYAQAVRRDVNLILVLDRSGSMANAGVCGIMVGSAQNFVSKFSNNRDTLGLVTFSWGASLDYVPSKTFDSAPTLNSVLSTLQCAGGTNTADALTMAYAQIKSIAQPGALNVIVFFTDGRPTLIDANYPVKTLKDDRYTADNGFSAIVSGVPPSPCPASAVASGLTGTLAAFDSGPPTGWSEGIFSSVPPPISSTNAWTTQIPPAPCASAGTNGYNSVYASKDIAYIPVVDVHGNSTVGYQTAGSGSSWPDYFPAGHTYAGLLRPDTPQSIIHACVNAADSASKSILYDTTYNIVTFSLGLGGDSSVPIDPDFMERVANSPQSSRFDNSRPVGLYVYAPTSADLSAAFSTIASEILRIAK